MLLEFDTGTKISDSVSCSNALLSYILFSDLCLCLFSLVLGRAYCKAIFVSICTRILGIYNSGHYAAVFQHKSLFVVLLFANNTCPLFLYMFS